ncbi:MAG: hypothetical protein JWM19_5299 [Actinomycetia bacterium]|nr:hypothetical protein [Actinomycetes bacterium]
MQLCTGLASRVGFECPVQHQRHRVTQVCRASPVLNDDANRTSYSAGFRQQSATSDDPGRNDWFRKRAPESTTRQPDQAKSA